MCFKTSVPKPTPVAPTPTIDDDAVRTRQQQEAARLAAESGRASTMVSDLNPSQVGGQRRVLLGA